MVVVVVAVVILIIVVVVLLLLLVLLVIVLVLVLAVVCVRQQDFSTEAKTLKFKLKIFLQRIKHWSRSGCQWHAIAQWRSSHSINAYDSFLLPPLLVTEKFT